MSSKFLYKLFLYVLSVTLIIGIINALLSANSRDAGQSEIWSELFNENVKPNVIIIGASHAAQGLNPKYLESNGIRIFNFAISGNNPIATLNWYTRLFKEYHTKPVLIIYEVNWFLFDSDWLTLKYEHFSYFFPWNIFIKELINIDNDFEMLILSRFPPTYRILKEALLTDLATTNKDSSDYYNGFTPGNSKPFKLDINRSVSTRISHEQKHAFIELLGRFKNDSINVVLVQVPEYLEGRSCAAIRQNNSVIKTIATENQIEFINFNEEKVSYINNDKYLYSDWGHLNPNGSTQFSILLSRELKPIFHKLNLFSKTDRPR
jgi:hypothetical protein